MVRDNIIFCASLAEAFISAAMVYPDKELPPGRLVRFSTHGKPDDTAGWCRVFPDGIGAAFGCNRAGTSYLWQQRDLIAPLPSKAERQAAKAKHEHTRKLAAAEDASQHSKAAETAARIWRESAELDPAHEYVTRKGISPYFAREDCDGSVLLPVYGATGDLQSLQFIGVDGGKRFLYQSKMKGGRLFIGEPVDGLTLILAEGWATACSIHEATGSTGVIAFFGGNLDDVAAELRRQFPNSPLRIAGDLDAHGKGLQYARAAASAGAGVVVMPMFADGRAKGDFNDLHQAEGLVAVRQQLNAKCDTTSRDVAPFAAPGLPKCDARDGTSDTRPLTELGNAQRMSDAYSDCLRYVQDAQSWIVWNGGAWHWNVGAGVRSMAAALPAAIYTEGAQYINDAEHFARWARKSQEQRTINAAVSMLSDFAPIRLPLAHIDSDHFTIGFNQARDVINLRNGATRAAMRSDYITKSLNAETVGDASKAVRWVQFLEQIFNSDQELIDWLQRFAGYLLTGSTREQIFLFCFGHGANGKSVFIEVFKHIIGDYSRAIASETLSEGKRQAGGATPDLAALIGARLVLCSETEDNSALAESLVKSLVAGDSMAVRQLYAAPVQFTPNFKLVMAGNHKPVVRGNDNGIWRRVRLVPFNRTFSPEERDPHLLAKLKAETPHILAWMIQGCIDWQRLGLADTPATIRQATDAYQVDQDLTGRWLEECTTPSAHSTTASGDLYASYRTWSMDNGLRPASSTALGRRLDERGYSRGKSGGVRVWFGLSLTNANSANAGTYAQEKDGR